MDAAWLTISCPPFDVLLRIDWILLAAAMLHALLAYSTNSFKGANCRWRVRIALALVKATWAAGADVVHSALHVDVPTWIRLQSVAAALMRLRCYATIPVPMRGDGHAQGGLAQGHGRHPDSAAGARHSLLLLAARQNGRIMWRALQMGRRTPLQRQPDRPQRKHRRHPGDEHTDILYMPECRWTIPCMRRTRTRLRVRRPAQTVSPRRLWRVSVMTTRKTMMHSPRRYHNPRTSSRRLLYFPARLPLNGSVLDLCHT